MIEKKIKNVLKTKIRVYKPYLDIVDLKSYKPAVLNIASASDLNPEEARVFAFEILKAAREAKKLNKQVQEGTYIPL